MVIIDQLFYYTTEMQQQMGKANSSIEVNFLKNKFSWQSYSEGNKAEWELENDCRGFIFIG